MAEALYQYQEEDLRFLSEWGRSANFSEPGVGKTPVAVRLVQELDGLPCIIVVPNVARYHWEEAIKRFWVGTPPRVVQYQGDRQRRQSIRMDDFDILIVGYELFRKDFNEYFAAQRYKMAVFDEAHRLKNPKAQVSKCAYKLKAEYKHVVTGTPIVNSFADVFSYLHLLFPDQFKSYWRFIHEYGIIVHNGFGMEVVGIKPDKQAKLSRILRQFSVRRTKREVLPFLPDKTYSRMYVDMLPKQRQLYDELRNYMIAELGQEIVEAPNILTQMLRLRQIALSPRLVGLNCDESAKLQALLEYLLEERIPAKKQTVIMTEFLQWARLLERELSKKGVRVVSITGDRTSHQKYQAQQAFQEGDADVAVCTIKAAGVSIDLTAADTVIFTDLSWTDVDNKQAEDRVHRASQTKKVQIIHLFAKDSIDDVIFDRTLLKALTSRRILDNDEKEKLKVLIS